VLTPAATTLPFGSRATATPALAAAIGGSVVGLAGVLFGWFNSGSERKNAHRLALSEREHERALAREARLNTEVRQAYGLVCPSSGPRK
jgi:hypothetical protein